MPYVSKAQERFFHTDTARKKGITKAEIDEYDKSSKGMKLPKRAAPKAAARRTGRRGS